MEGRRNTNKPEVQHSSTHSLHNTGHFSLFFHSKIWILAPVYGCPPCLNYGNTAVIGGRKGWEGAPFSDLLVIKTVFSWTFAAPVHSGVSQFNPALDQSSRYRKDTSSFSLSPYSSLNVDFYLQSAWYSSSFRILRYLIFVFVQSFWLHLEGNMGSSVYSFYFSQH